MEPRRLLSIFSTPLIIFAIFFDMNFLLNKVKANNKVMAANSNDLALYQRMGISYVCLASRKGIDLELPKSLSVASTTFLTVVQQKHGGLILEGEEAKEIKIDPKTLYENVYFRLIGGALEVCPDNVPDQIEKDFKKELKRIQKLNKK